MAGEQGYFKKYIGRPIEINIQLILTIVQLYEEVFHLEKDGK